MVVVLYLKNFIRNANIFLFSWSLQLFSQDYNLVSYAIDITYIHYWSLQAFSQNYGLASHTTHVVLPEWRDLQFNIDSERQIS